MAVCTPGQVSYIQNSYLHRMHTHTRARARTHTLNMHTHTLQHTHSTLTQSHARTHSLTRARAHTHTDTHSHTHAHIHTHAHTHTLADTHSHTHTRAHTHSHTRTRTHAHTHTHTHTQCRQVSTWFETLDVRTQFLIQNWICECYWYMCIWLVYVHMTGICAYHWYMCVSLVYVRITGMCAYDWYVCIWLVYVHMTGICAYHWYMCISLVYVQITGICADHWYMSKCYHIWDHVHSDAIQPGNHFLFLHQQLLFLTETSRSHSGTPQSAALLWTGDQLVAKTSAWQHTTLTTDTPMTPSGIRTRNPSKRPSADPRLRPCGHWDRQPFHCWTVC